jgi:tetratricopeptide (TPR) repeat protein
MKSNLEYERNDPNEAIRLAEQAIAAKSDFGPAYTQLGLYYQIGAMDDAIRNYEKALQYNPESSTAELNLGYCRLLLTEFPKAIELLDSSKRRVPRMQTNLLLGEAYRYNLQFHEALQIHEEARQTLDQYKGKEDDLFAIRYLEGEWVLNYMASKPGDRETINQGIKVYALNYMKALLSYALSFDYATLDNFPKAEEKYKEAEQLGGLPTLMRTYIMSQITYMQKNLEMSPPAHAWFERKAKTLL